MTILKAESIKLAFSLIFLYVEKADIINVSVSKRVDF